MRMDDRSRVVLATLIPSRNRIPTLNPMDNMDMDIRSEKAA